ncbi:MAG: mannonate dehydratase [Methylobacteriaceae bacterium]|nr:mannonate dehydratase [Methylobacteriaceae bacterium]MBV9704759.1 mannonate dehydratase [Methylobacteriaceae bacterium]
MRQAWRWFGPDDPVNLDHIRQAGATDIVSALHDVAPGVAWTREGVETRQRIIEDTPPGRTPLVWSVVESIPLADEIKRLGKGAKGAIEAWIASLEAVASAGIRTVCYNIMPVVDWTRTDLDWPMPTGATALRFGFDRFAAFDIFILKRQGATASYDEAVQARARSVFEAMDEAAIDTLTRTICAGLPGTTTDALDLGAFRERIASYHAIDADTLRRHAVEFLEAVTPAAEARGVRLTLHPDDPPRSLLGLPRIASTQADYEALFKSVPSPANGICFCTGSLGASPLNNLVAIVNAFASRIHFAHLRATRTEEDGNSFYEADHLDGDFDMISVLKALLAEDHGRKPDGKIPFRPDHGHQMIDDLGKRTNPGYSAIGRLKGLAELRGAIRALEEA